MSVNVLPPEVSGGGEVTAIFQVMNQANYDLTGVDLNIYDPCIFSGEHEKNIGTLKSNQTTSWTWSLTASDVTLSRDCQLKFRLAYTGKLYFYQDVAVLSQSEYNLRLMQGTLQSIPLSSSSSSSPLKIYLTFTQGQPFIDGSSVDSQINYAYTGNGYISISSVNMQVPSNMVVSNCKDYPGGTLQRQLNFINKKATPSVCTFTATANQPIDIKSLTLTADYTYTLDNYIPVRVTASESITSGSSTPVSSQPSSSQTTTTPTPPPGTPSTGAGAR
jgi:hypothetical protein